MTEIQQTLIFPERRNNKQVYKIHPNYKNSVNYDIVLSKTGRPIDFTLRNNS